MAEEDKKKPGKENPEAPKEGAEQKTPEKKSLFSKKNIIIFVILIALLGGGAVVGLKKMSAKKTGEVKHGENSESEEKNGEESESKEKKGEDGKKVKKNIIFSFTPTVVNISGTNGSRYLKVTVAVQFNNEILREEINDKKFQLQDIISTILSAKTLDQVIDLAERDNMKREIRDKFNEVLEDGKIINVFFSDYITQ